MSRYWHSDYGGAGFFSLWVLRSNCGMKLLIGTTYFPATLTWRHQISCLSVHAEELGLQLYSYRFGITRYKVHQGIFQEHQKLDTVDVMQEEKPEMPLKRSRCRRNQYRRGCLSSSAVFNIRTFSNCPFAWYLSILRLMGKAPAAAVDFDGSGQVWFKILGLGPTCSGGWVTWPLSDLLNFPPSIIPANQLSDTYSCNVTKNLPSGH